MRLVLDSDIQEIVTRTEVSLKRLSGKSLLLTGAAGFLGTYFNQVFINLNTMLRNSGLAPVQVTAVDSFITGGSIDEVSGANEDVVWLSRDLSVDASFDSKFDYILHCAGIASPEHYRANPLKTIDVTIRATRELLEKAKNEGSRMVFFSSSEIYGDPTPENVPTVEAYRGNVSTRGPRACYDESKRLGETLCWVYQTYFDVHVSVVRPFNVYGPGMLPRDYRVLPNFATSVSKGLPLNIYGSGNQTRTFCYVTDAIVAFLEVLISVENPDVFNVGNPSPEISMIDLAKLVSSISNHAPGAHVVAYPETYPEDEPNRRCPDISKLKETLGYVPSVDLETGLTRFLSWTKTNYPTLIANSSH